jgi:hypothetical protein
LPVNNDNLQMNTFTTPEWLGICLAILITGMPRGGLPISGVALPLLVLLWPEQGQAARSAVSFILPLLCVMDIVAVILYRGKPDWSHIKKLLPSAIAGIIIASLLFVSDSGISFSDRTLKLAIGLLGLVFTAWHLWGKRLYKTLDNYADNNLIRPVLYGFSGGFTSTIAHAAGPVMQMYFLPIIPAGVLTGYVIVRTMPELYYRGFIYLALSLTSGLLVYNALTAG